MSAYICEILTIYKAEQLFSIYYNFFIILNFYPCPSKRKKKKWKLILHIIRSFFEFTEMIKLYFLFDEYYFKYLCFLSALNPCF